MVFRTAVTCIITFQNLYTTSLLGESRCFSPSILVNCTLASCCLAHSSYVCNLLTKSALSLSVFAFHSTVALLTTVIALNEYPVLFLPSGRLRGFLHGFNWPLGSPLLLHVPSEMLLLRSSLPYIAILFDTLYHFSHI